MPPVISSAVAGKKSAPKGPARRRAAPAATRPAETEDQQQPEVALPSPAATQSERHPSPALPQTERAVTPPSQNADAAPEPLAAADANDAALTGSDTQHEPQSEPQTSAQAETLTTTQVPDSAGNVPTPTTEPHVDPAAPTTTTTAPGVESQATPAETSPNTRKRQREAEPAKRPARPAKQPKRSSTRANARGQAVVNAPGSAAVVPTTEQEDTPVEDPVVESSTQAPTRPKAKPKAKPKKKTAKSKATVTAADQETETEQEETDREEAQTEGQETTAPVPKKKRGRKRTKASRATNVEGTADGEGGEGIEGEGDGEEDESDGSDPEAHEINPNTLSMFELSHDSRHGKVSTREKKMAEIDWDDVARKRRAAADRVALGEQPVAEEGAEAPTGEGADATPAPQPDSGAPAGGVQFRIVNGQIVEDESSLTIDRQAQAEANAQNNEPVEEENDLTARINRTAWINDRRREPKERLPLSSYKSDPWSEDDTDKFYEALRMFGTDFFIISKMFAPRTRKQLKHKFNREEKLDPTRINNALLGKETKPMNLEHYARESGREVSAFTKYESYEDANNAIRASMKDKEEAMHAALKEEAENNRQEKIQQVQRDKQKAAAEKKKAANKAVRKGFKGRMGAGTMGGGPEDA